MIRESAYDFIDLLMKEGWSDIATNNPTALSCGGIYIPPRDSDSARFSYEILNTPSEAEPVKVVVSKPIRNLLKIVIERGTLN